MVLDMDQAQRRDIDVVSEDRITLALDEENITQSPYTFEPKNFIGNNWFKQGNNIVKLSLAEQDSIVFLSAPLDNLVQKDITNIIVGFDYDISNVSGNYPILSNISLTCMEMTNYFLVENILTTQGHIDIDCSLFNFSSNVVNTSISEQGFKVGLNFVGVKSNATVKLSNVQIKFKFENKLQEEILAVANRISASFDFYVEEDELIVDFLGDGSSGGGSSGGGADVELVKRMIREAIGRLDIDLEMDLMSNGYLKLKTELNKENV